MSTLGEHTPFLKLVERLDHYGVPWWLDQGTLLGLVRDDRLIESDHDIDLGVWAADFNPYRHAIASDLRSEGFRVKARYRHTFGMRDREYRFREVNIAIFTRVGNIARKKVTRPPSVYRQPRRSAITGLRSLVKVGYESADDILPGSKQYRMARVLERILPRFALRTLGLTARGGLHIIDRKMRMDCDAAYFDTRSTLQHDGLTLPVPSNAEDYLELKYGAGWKTPDDSWEYWKQDGAIQ